MLLGVGLCGPFGSVEVLLELCGREIAEVAVQALGVVPVHPAERRQFDVFDGLSGAAARGSADQLGLVEPDHGFGEGVIE